MALRLTALRFSPLRRCSSDTLVHAFKSDTSRQKRYICNSLSHANKSSDVTQDDRRSRIPVVSTKAEVRFHVQTAQWIPEEVRREILLKNTTRVNKAGELIVTSEVSRSQHRNLEDCLQKLSDIITEASVRPPEPSAEDAALRAQRLEKRNLMRLKQKKINAATKQARRVDFD